jgi:hypothetical protein
MVPRAAASARSSTGGKDAFIRPVRVVLPAASVNHTSHSSGVAPFVLSSAVARFVSTMSAVASVLPAATSTAPVSATSRSATWLAVQPSGAPGPLRTEVMRTALLRLRRWMPTQASQGGFIDR